MIRMATINSSGTHDNDDDIGSLKTGDQYQEDLSVQGKQSQKGKESARNLVAFWMFGLCNAFAYVVMLSAAHDILTTHSSSSDIVPLNTSNATFPTSLSLIESTSNSSRFDCNPLSTGIILLADILPAIVVKCTAPCYLHYIPYGVRIILCVGFGLASFLIVGLIEVVWIDLIGVACASISAAIGEITFLSLTTFYDNNVVSTWSSGTGGAGIFGALSYAGLTSVGISPRKSVLLMTVVPVIEGASYWILLTKRPSNFTTDNQHLHIQYQPEGIDRDSEPLLEETEMRRIPPLTTRIRIQLVWTMMSYMGPLAAVYIAEYFINQGLIEIVYFPGISWLNHAEQYRWFQVDYQLGVFISRSSVNCIKIKKIWLLAILQFINVVIVLLQIFLEFIPTIWILFALVFYEGLLGGGAYVNTFYRVSTEVEVEYREYCMGVTSMADTCGIAIAAIAAVPVHNKLCSL
ncbi:battenin-like [Glandiceps talaboti]